MSYASKYDDGEGSAGGKRGEEGAPPAVIDVTDIRVDEASGPSSGAGPMDLDAALHLEIDYGSDRDLCDARWSVAFVVDIVSKRYIVDLGVQERVQVREGTNSFVFSLDSLDVSRVKRKHLLNNAGLLVATLVTGDGRDVISVNLVVQTAHSKDRDTLLRHILNPLR
eukprot:g2299.t1